MYVNMSDHDLTHPFKYRKTRDDKTLDIRLNELGLLQSHELRRSAAQHPSLNNNIWLY